MTNLNHKEVRVAELRTAEEVRASMKTIAGWKRRRKEIVRVFEFKDFVNAMKFVNKVAAMAEKHKHHPDIDIRWNKVTLVLSTHSAGGLTIKDFQLACAIDLL